MKENKHVFRSLAMVTQLGLTVMVPVFLCVFAGRYVDRHFGTHLSFVFLIVGFLAGIASAWRLAMRIVKMEQEDERKKEEERLAHWQERQPGQPKVTIPKEKSRVKKDGEDLYD